MPTPAPGGSDNTQMEASGVCNLPPHVAMLVSPGMGHLIPFAELARRLAARHGITATLITFASTSSATQRAFLASLPPTIASISLPRVNLSDLPAGAAIETLMSEECVRVLPALTGVLSELRGTTRLVAFVADIFGAVLLALRVHGVLGPLDEPLRDVGLLVPSWAPQIKVLAQEATGGFLVHCGWNSVLESLVHGVPMVAWPLYAEQRQNAVLLTEGVGAVIRVPDTKNKHEIAMAVKEVMAGQGKGAEVRAKVAKLQKAAMEGLREGGAATTV